MLRWIYTQLDRSHQGSQPLARERVEGRWTSWAEFSKAREERWAGPGQAGARDQEGPGLKLTESTVHLNVSSSRHKSYEPHIAPDHNVPFQGRVGIDCRYQFIL